MSDHHQLFTLRATVHPAVGWVFLMRSVEELVRTAEMVDRLTTWLTGADIAHNLMIARLGHTVVRTIVTLPSGKNFRSAGAAGGEVLDNVRVFVWVRKNVVTKPDYSVLPFVSACTELAGSVVIYKVSDNLGTCQIVLRYSHDCVGGHI